MRVRSPSAGAVLGRALAGAVLASAVLAGCGSSAAGPVAGPVLGTSSTSPSPTSPSPTQVPSSPGLARITAIAPPGTPTSAARSSTAPTSVPPATRTTTPHPATTPTPKTATSKTANPETATPETAHLATTHPATAHPAPSSTPRDTTPPATRHAPGTGALAGTVVVIDPGHNGANGAHPEIITKQVPAGFGEYKDCNTTGTETDAGYPEYRFNWKVGVALREALQAKGITVVMTRPSDEGVGPCVNDRAAIGNDAHADAVISIHGDGEAADVKGFYVMTAERAPAGASTAARSGSLAATVRDGLAGAGFPTSNTLGSNGLWQRSDLAGLNLSTRPTVMIECGNMRNPTEAALMSSSAGQQRYADGIAAGVVAYLQG